MNMFPPITYLVFALLSPATSFTVPWRTPLSTTFGMSNTEISEISSMRLKEIQTELKERQVSFGDCFDKESLVARLVEARNGTFKPASKNESNPTSQAVESAPAPRVASEFDRENTLAKLRSMRVAELRTELANRRIRWANMFEKDDLVKALLTSMEASAIFSVSGALTPGEVGMVTGEELDMELSGGASTPLILDIYATWCGPCKLMAPQLDQAAKELGSAVRVAKIDSDKFPQWSSKLKVGAFPTVIVFDGMGKEVERVEGALTRDQIVQLVNSHL